MKLLYLLFVCGFGASKVDSSAIPMWEFLSKDEKMSYLYSMFANQVEQFCGKSTMVNCNKELLKYGLGKLKDMPEDHLDVMDPYQRGANDIIWDSMMEGHEMMKTTKSRPPTTTTKPNSYDDDSFGDYGAASAKIDNVYRVAPPKGFVYTIQTGTPQYTYTPSVGPYSKFQQTHTPEKYVVKVYPDGRPVVEHTSQLPQDDDLRQYQLSKVKIPNL
ncbi:rhythmically expressed gene 5 protein [Tribolium madens]|uniref:rhythmically expressed gene 5 protein n=1 Tax=Tribolium madens TaxID=41895 RepID=UPI001CF734A4|nr:rhythmically expressed gene 5 protein [Tribolium madens]